MILSVLALVLGLVGCSGSNNNDSTSTPEVTPQATVSVETVYPVTVTGSDGTEVTIEKEPTKIISVGPNITEMIYKVGAGDLLVGRTKYCDYPSEVESVPTIGSLLSPDIEAIVAAQPDVVFASTHFKEDAAAKLTELGIPVVVLYEKTELNGIYKMIETLGIALNKQKEAAETNAEAKAKIEEVEEKVKGAEAVSAYYVVGFGEKGDFTAGGDTFIGKMITLAGGDNIAKDVEGWSYSLENLLEKDPSVIIVKQGQKDEFMQAENYKELTAVKEDRVYEIDNNLLDRQGYRNALGLEELAKILHPELFK